MTLFASLASCERRAALSLGLVGGFDEAGAEFCHLGLRDLGIIRVVAKESTIWNIFCSLKPFYRSIDQDIARF